MRPEGWRSETPPRVQNCETKDYDISAPKPEQRMFSMIQVCQMSELLQRCSFDDLSVCEKSFGNRLLRFSEAFPRLLVLHLIAAVVPVRA